MDIAKISVMTNEKYNSAWSGLHDYSFRGHNNYIMHWSQNKSKWVVSLGYKMGLLYSTDIAVELKVGLMECWPRLLSVCEAPSVCSC